MGIAPVTVAFYLPIPVQHITLLCSEGLGKCFGFFPTLCCHSMPVFAACYCSSSSVSSIHLPCGSYFTHSVRILIPAWSVLLKWWLQSGLVIGLPWAVKLVQWTLDSFLSVLLWLSMWVWVHLCFIQPAGALAVNFMSISSMGIEYCGGIVLSLYNLLVL